MNRTPLKHMTAHARLNPLILIPLCCALLFSAGPVSAEETSGSMPDATEAGYLRQELRLNQFGGSTQERCVLSLDGNGDYLLAWDSRRQQGGAYGVYARRVSPDGRILCDEFALNLQRKSHQMSPALAGGLAVWESWGQDGSGRALLGRIGDGDEFLLAERSDGDQCMPLLLTLPGERHLVAWVTPDESGRGRIAARLFSADGTALGGERDISAPGAPGYMAGGNDMLPCAALTDDGVLIAWTRQHVDGGSAIRGRLFDEDLSPLGDEMNLAEAGFEASLAPAAEGCVLAWHSIEDGNCRVRLRRLSADGSALGETIPAGGPAGWQSGAVLATNSMGELALAWNQIDTAGEDSDILLRLFNIANDAEPTALAAPFRVNENAEGWQGLAVASGASRLHLADDGLVALAWNGNSGRGDHSAVNLSLLRPLPANPLARLALRCRLAWNRLTERPRHEDAPASNAAAMPHIPPVFDPDQVLGSIDPEPYLPAAPGRDEGWQGISNTGWTPPDPHVAVGPNQVMAMTNGGIAAFEKDGTPVWQDAIEGSGGFWGGQGATGFVFDPEIIFDPHADRFMAMACERGSDNHSYFLLGVSSSADPSDPWHKYRLDVTALAGTDIDSPNMSVDAEAIYLTADFFGPDDYLIYIIDKSSVLSGGSPVTTHYLHSGSQSFGIPVQYGDAPAMYMLRDFEGYSEDSIRIYGIIDPLGSPSLTYYDLPVPTYWRPVSSHSLGTSATVTVFEARFWSCVYRNGSLWACHHIAPTSARNSDAARWYEIEMNGWPGGGTPSLRQSGSVLPNGYGYATFNSISVNAYGDAAMCFAYSSASDRFSMVRVARNATDALGEMGEPVFIKTSSSTYSGSRWGDYSAIAVDPYDDLRFWAIHEYAVGSSTWSTWIANFQVNDLTAVADHWPAQITGTWPSPSSGPTRLGFSLAGASRISLEIFDVRGRLVRHLDGGELDAGVHELFWDGLDEGGRPVAAGSYVSRLEVNGLKQPGHKLIILR